MESQLPLKGAHPQFSADVYCRQTVGWMKTPLGMDLGSGHIVLDGKPAPPRKGHDMSLLFGPCLLWPLSPISATAELVTSRNIAANTDIIIVDQLIYTTCIGLWISTNYNVFLSISLWPPCVAEAAIIFCPVVSSSFLCPPYGIWQAIIFLPCVFYLSSFFYLFSRLISAVADWMSTKLRHMMWP